MFVSKYCMYVKCPHCEHEESYVGNAFGVDKEILTVVCKKCSTTLLKIKTEKYKENPVLTMGNIEGE